MANLSWRGYLIIAEKVLIIQETNAKHFYLTSWGKIDLKKRKQDGAKYTIV
jgi:hypothetical protein